jgi:hypothetical protein
MFADDSVIAEKQNGEYQRNTFTEGLFASVLKSPIQMGSLSIYNYHEYLMLGNGHL